LGGKQESFKKEAAGRESWRVTGTANKVGARAGVGDRSSNVPPGAFNPWKNVQVCP